MHLSHHWERLLHQPAFADFVGVDFLGLHGDQVMLKLFCCHHESCPKMPNGLPRLNVCQVALWIGFYGIWPPVMPTRADLPAMNGVLDPIRATSSHYALICNQYII